MDPTQDDLENQAFLKWVESRFPGGKLQFDEEHDVAADAFPFDGQQAEAFREAQVRRLIKCWYEWKEEKRTKRRRKGK